MAGHLFLLKSDIRVLASDAWLLPTDRQQRLMESWRRGWSRGFEMPPEPPAPADWRRGSIREWPDWPGDRATPWLAAVGPSSKDAASWPADTAQRWLEAVADRLRGTRPRHGRAKHLVALPVLGTGAGGQHRHAGEVLQALVPMLREQAAALDLDVALVCVDDETFAAARAVRDSSEEAWPELDRREIRQARGLAELAGAGDLVLFLGAGVSVGAGMPDWRLLLAELASELDVDIEAPGWSELDVLDQASIIQRRLDKHGSIGLLISDRFKLPEASLQHTLLADLPVSEVVTTNYDDLFELAAGPHRVSVIPHAPRADARRWLLKMHGCVNCPDDVVLTREDYLRYEQRRVALAGIVQAMLMTRHMLFVGFSLKDENFHKVADAVRRARAPGHYVKLARGERRPDSRSHDGASRRGVDGREAGLRPGAGKFGTVLKLADEPFVEELWAHDLDFVTMGDELPQGAEARRRALAERARRLEIFLDCLLAHAPVDPLHFFHRRFSSTLTEGELAFRDALEELLASLPADARRGPAWERLRELITRLGG